MQQPLGDLQDAFTELNINIPNEEEQQDYLLPQWKDITLFLDKATDEFDVGQLVHLQSFTLFDAMSAIEIMDPRMDTGMAIEHTFETFNVEKRLSPEDTLGIMDNLVVREMAWISGHSLAQTVYTCIYFHHIQRLNESSMPTLTSNMDDIVYGVLRCYILATVKCCQYIWTEMTLGNVYEEEDCTTNLFGLHFNDQNPDVMIFNDIDSSIMLLNHLLNTTISDSEKNIVSAILNRVEIRRSFLMSLVYLSKLEGSFLPAAKSELKKIIDLLKNVDLSIGNAVSDAFDPNINRKLTSQTPPRPVELSSIDQSFKDYTLLIQRLCSICKVIDYPSVNSLMNYFMNFAAHQPYPDAFSRSKLNSIFFHNQRIFGEIVVSKFILDSIKETVQPPLWWTLPTAKPPANVDAAEFINAHGTLKAYLDRISMVFVEYFKINCHNRSRQRRMLCKVVAEWEILQEEAAGVDEVFHALEHDDAPSPYYFSSWAYNLKLTMIEKVLFLGFELDLYGPHEYTMIYWYIQCVLGSRAYLLDRISNFIDKTIESPGIYNYLYTNQLLNRSKKCMSEAMLKLLLTAKCTHQFDQRTLVFDDQETRYSHRFKPFVALISPPHPSYQQYSEIVHGIQDFDAARMKEIAKTDFEDARKLLESVRVMSREETNTEMCHVDFKEDTKNLIRTIVANCIGMIYIDQEASPKTNMVTDFSYHPWFPVLVKK